MVTKGKSNRRKNNKFSPLDLLREAFNAEFSTEEGKINYRGGLLLLIGIIVCSTKDWFTIVASYVRECIKTYILGTDVKEEVETVNTTLLLMMLFVFFVLCVSVIQYRLHKQKQLEKDNSN